MNPDLDQLLTLLPCHDIRPERAARIRQDAQALLGRQSTLPGRLRGLCAHVYARLLEPVLVTVTIVFSLSWAAGRIVFIIR